MNKQNLINKIKQLEGLTHDDRAELINLLNTKKKYGLIWEDKPEVVEEELRTHLPVLREIEEKRILSVDNVPAKVENKKQEQSLLFEEEAGNTNKNLKPESKQLPPNHILIEGDNLHALTALTFTHAGKIDVIYIDPPYNTGNKDFKYNDSYVDKEDSYRHSKWLSFMHKRLEIAMLLLSDKGVIFISINDIEQAQLKIILSELFNENNFVANLVWSNKEGGGSSDSKHFRLKHEYILCYAKNIQNINFKGVEISNRERYTSSDKFENIRGPYYLQKLGMGSIQYSNSLDYEIETPDGTFTTPKLNNSGKKACWRWSKIKFEWGLINEFIEFKKDKNSNWIVYTKQYLNCDNEGNLIERTQRPFGVIDTFSSTQGAKNLEDIGLSKMFNYSKPSALIKYLLDISTHVDTTILDFFAGSGTTLHATMQLNAEDGGNRQCILATNNENNICEEVTYERNRRVIQGYKNSKGTWVNGLKGNNLRYYKIDFVPSTKTELNKRFLAQCSSDLLCIKEDCYNELTESLNFNPVQCKIFTNNKGRYLIVVYHSRKQLEVNEKLINYIKTLDNLSENIRLYAFIPEKETLLEDFAEVADKIEAVPLPEAIYNAYRATFRSLKLDKKEPVGNVAKLEDSENENEIVVITQDEE